MPCRQYSLLWRHNGRDGVSNHQPLDSLLNGSFRRRSKKTSELRVTGLCAGNSPATGGFPAPMASNAENVLMTSSCLFKIHSLQFATHRWIVLLVTKITYSNMTFNKECCVRSRYQGQGQVITSRRYCVVQLIAFVKGIAKSPRNAIKHCGVEVRYLKSIEDFNVADGLIFTREYEHEKGFLVTSWSAKKYTHNI